MVVGLVKRGRISAVRSTRCCFSPDRTDACLVGLLRTPIAGEMNPGGPEPSVLRGHNIPFSERTTMKLIFSLAVCCVAGAYAVGGSAEPQIQKQSGVAGQSQQRTEAARLRAAQDLLKVMGSEETHKRTIDQMLEVQMKQMPQLRPMRGVMVRFFEKHMGWESLKEDIAKIYAKRFTVAELGELARFYKTPIGRKAIRLLPEIAAEGAMIGQTRVQKNMGELQAMIREEMAKQQAGKKDQ